MFGDERLGLIILDAVSSSQKIWLYLVTSMMFECKQRSEV